MTPEQAATATATTLPVLGSHFMLDAATYAGGAELGFDGIDFYTTGRGGALGDVDADVVSAAFVFFNPGHVRRSWQAGRAVMDPTEAARHWATACHDWGRAHLPDDLDSTRLAELAGKVVASASPAGAPLFGGWRALPEPDDPSALAMHRLNGLRELRGAIHGAAVVASELTPLEAVMVKQPYMAQVFGWTEPFPAVDAKHDAWSSAESATDRSFGRALTALDEAELVELVELVGAAHTSAEPAG